MNYTKENISATVILYKPTEEIFINIDSYVNFVDKLIVVDNSEIQNESLINKLHTKYTNIEYIQNGENLGIATALNIACDRANEYNYDWILTMDQDSCFLNFQEYTECLNNIPNPDNTAIVAAKNIRNAKNNKVNNPSFKFKEKFFAITSASLLNLKLFDKIGRFEDKLFIDSVDFDYCTKANVHGYKILQFKDILVEHSLGSEFERNNIITGNVKTIIEHSPQRIYYITRNKLYAWKKYSKQFPKEFRIIKIVKKLFIYRIIRILLYEDQKIQKIKARLLGLYHFIIGRYGKYVL